jgi:phage/plasmid-like protein (TIGR03299 family)
MKSWYVNFLFMVYSTNTNQPTERITNMSANLDNTTGSAAFAEFGDRVTAWHQEGRTISDADFAGRTTAEKISLVLERARLGWLVEPHDVYDVTGQMIRGWKSFERDDTGHRMGIFPESYTVMQNHELLSLVEPLIDAGMVEWETAGALRKGEDVWFLMRFNPQDPAVAEWFAEEGMRTYALLVNNHSRKRLLTIMETMIRVVCANTLGAATSRLSRRSAGRYPGAVLLRHTKNVKSLSVDAVNDLWARITERYGRVQESYVAMKSRFLSEEEFTANVLDVLTPYPDVPVDGGDGRFEAALARASARRELVTDLYRGTGRGIDGTPTAFNAYMAVTEAVDHYPDMFRTRVSRLTALIPGGTLANKKQDVLNALHALP